MKMISGSFWSALASLRIHSFHSRTVTSAQLQDSSTLPHSGLRGLFQLDSTRGCFEPPGLGHHQAARHRRPRAHTLLRARLHLHHLPPRVHLRARNPIAEAQRSLLNCWMVNGYKFRWNMAFCSRITIDTAWGHLIFSVFSAFRVFTSQEKPRTEKLKNWIAQEKNGPQTSPMEFSFSVFQFSHCWCLKFNRNKIGAKIYKIHCKYQ